MGNCFSVLFQATIYILAFKKCKKDGNIPRVILVQGFCPLKTEIARFPIGLGLKCSKIKLRRTKIVNVTITRNV